MSSKTMIVTADEEAVLLAYRAYKTAQAAKKRAEKAAAEAAATMSAREADCAAKAETLRKFLA
jgi:hypothetical protein